MPAVIEVASEAGPGRAPDRTGRERSRLRALRPHLIVAALSLALAAYVLSGLWSDPFDRTIAENAGDHAFFEWLLGYGVYTLGHGADPFYTWMMNAPLGVNLAANTSVTVYTTLMAPVTFLAGPQISFVTLLTLNLAGAAFGWWLFLRRFLVSSPVAAGLGGIVLGFAPGFVSHAHGHLNWSAGWIVPAVLWGLLRLRQPGRWLRNGAVLGLLVTVGFSIAAEGLFLLALAGAGFLVLWSLPGATRGEARTAAPTVLAGLAVTALVAGTLLSYPLYMHFAGPRTFTGTGFSQIYYSESLVSFLQFPNSSVAGRWGFGTLSSPNATEETSYLGWPLMMLVTVGSVTLWRHSAPGRRATLAALGIVGLVFFVLSLGPQLRINSLRTEIELPYATLARLPLFDSALPARMALVPVVVVGIVFALLADRIFTTPLRRSSSTLWTGAVWLALLPILPAPIVTAARAPEPRFIADGIWQDYVSDNGVLTALPIFVGDTADPQRWQAYTMARGGKQFRIPGGYFLGPGGPDGHGQSGASFRQTDWLLSRVGYHGEHRDIGTFERQQARADFAYWDIEAVYLPDTVISVKEPFDRDAVLDVTTRLLGPPERVADVLLWRIRPGIDPVVTGAQK